MPTHKLNWIKKIQLKSSKQAIKQYGTESVQKNSSIKTYFSVLFKLIEKFWNNSFIQRMKSCIYSESLIETTCPHLLLLVGFDTLIYQQYYDTPPILVGHHHHTIIFIWESYWKYGLKYLACFYCIGKRDV